MTFIEKLFEDYEFFLAMEEAKAYCKIHQIKNSTIYDGKNVIFSWLDPEDDIIYSRLGRL